MRNFGFSDFGDDDAAEKPAAAARPCEHPDCKKVGEFRAPKSRDDLSAYYWFCLEHVRAYNAKWDFFSGMSQNEIESYQRNTTTWHRPTWRFGTKNKVPGAPESDPETKWRDDLGMLNEYRAVRNARPEPRRKTVRWHLAPERRALNTLGLTVEATMSEIKLRYKELAKRYHPDTNGGSTSAEDRLKDINQAYSFLVSRSRKAPRA